VLLSHVAFILQDGFQDCIRLYCVFVIYLIIFYGFFIKLKFFDCTHRYSFYEGVISA